MLNSVQRRHDQRRQQQGGVQVGRVTSSNGNGGLRVHTEVLNPQMLHNFVLAYRLVRQYNDGTQKNVRYRFYDNRNGKFYDIEASDASALGYREYLKEFPAVQEVRNVQGRLITAQEQQQKFRAEIIRDKRVIQYLLQKVIFPNAQVVKRAL